MSHPASVSWARAAIMLLLVAHPAAATAPGGPTTPVRDAYRIEREYLGRQRTSGHKAPWSASHRDKLFSKRFAALWATEERYGEATHEIGNIDHDPFIAAQDNQDDVLHDLVIDVVLENGRWVIDDIRNQMDGVVHSVSKMLAEPYWCTETWKERCRSGTP